MAVGTAAAITGGLGVGLNGYQTISGIINKDKAQKAIDGYDRQDLTNSFENIAIPTAGVDLMREETQRSNANLVDAARQGGSRGVIGAIPQIIGQNNVMNKQTQAYLDDLYNKRAYAIAGDNVNIRGMQEQRENADLAGLGQQLQTGRQDMFSGLSGLASSGAYIANNVEGWKNPNQTTDSDASSYQYSPSGAMPPRMSGDGSTGSYSQYGNRQYNPFAGMNFGNFRY